MMEVAKSFWNKATEFVTLDTRSLAVFRIGLALTTFFDLIDRARDLSAHYTDAGILSRELILANFQNPNWFSLHMMTGTAFGMSLLFIVHAIIAFFLLVGYKTKLMSILTWFFTISLQDRNIFLGHGGDVEFRVCLFFGMFLPLGEAFSMDSLMKSHPFNKKSEQSPKNYKICNIASIALIVQVMVMYFVAHRMKTGDEWRVDYTSTWLALQLDFFRRPMGDFLMQFPTICKFLTWAVLHWQNIGVFLYFSPIFTPQLKLLSVFGFWFMHLNFFMAFRLGLFGMITITSILALLPSYFWELLSSLKNKTDSKVHKRNSGVILYYHDQCKTCWFHCLLIKSIFMLPSNTIINSMSELHVLDEEVPCQCGNHCNWKEEDFQSGESNTFDSWIIIRDTQLTLRRNSSAMQRIIQLSFGYSLLRKIVSPTTINKCLLFIDKLILACHYHSLSYDDFKHKEISTKKKSETTPFLIQFFQLFATLLNQVTVGFFLYLIVCINSSALHYSLFAGGEKPFYPVVATLHLDQNWSMFAPRPPSVQWYYNIDATLANGKNVELFSNSALFTHIPNEQTWSHLTDFVSAFKNHRWFKFYENGLNSHAKNEILRLNFGRWICREYNKVNLGDERLHTFNIWFMPEQVNPKEPFAPRTSLNKQNLWSHQCY